MEKFNKPHELWHHKSVYIAGKITGSPNFAQNFLTAQKILNGKGFLTMNPAVLPAGFSHENYMHICYAMIDVCDAVVFLPDWEDSRGAQMEFLYCECEKKPKFLLSDIIRKSGIE